MSNRAQPILGIEVAAALAEGRAVVALESTIITHGMPFPANVETALAVENLVREAGAVPATIAVLDGHLRAGLSHDEIERLGADRNAVKASSRDLAVIMRKGLCAGTTVSATMLIAARAGLAIFATGGIGGVHRGAEETFDISADLVELGRTEVAVVSAGVKSILDIPKTLEYLETQRVPVIAVGTDDFPAFYSRESGCKADHRLDHPRDIAAVIRNHFALGCGTGLLIANPISSEAALSASDIAGHIDRAVEEARIRGIEKKALTPFLLARIAELSGGKSLQANMALIRDNAVMAARIALAYAELVRG